MKKAVTIVRTLTTIAIHTLPCQSKLEGIMTRSHILVVIFTRISFHVYTLKVCWPWSPPNDKKRLFLISSLLLSGSSFFFLRKKVSVELKKMKIHKCQKKATNVNKLNYSCLMELFIYSKVISSFNSKASSLSSSPPPPPSLLFCCFTYN